MDVVALDVMVIGMVAVVNGVIFDIVIVVVVSGTIVDIGVVVNIVAGSTVVVHSRLQGLPQKRCLRRFPIRTRGPTVAAVETVIGWSGSRNAIDWNATVGKFAHWCERREAGHGYVELCWCACSFCCC